MSIDPRLIERRKTVAEDNAKRNVARLLKFLLATITIGGAVWLVFSPWLSVAQVETDGIAASSGHAILADNRVVAGTPMIRLDARAVEAALLADPWVAEAEVILQWPHRVSVMVVERSSVAWTLTSDGWTRRAIDGVSLPSGPDPADDRMPRIELPTMSEAEALTSTTMLGALEFVSALEAVHAVGMVLTEHDGELWASVTGHQVRLGRAVDMTAKALSLSALLTEDLPEGSTVVLIAPTNPAVMSPPTDGS